MINLSEQQLKIVNSQEKHVAVVAGAGSGKTRVVIEKIKKIISENKRNKKVLAITFSNKAANEMRDRLLESYSQEELEEKVFVGTIHNFCLNIVRERANVIGINGELRIFESDKERKEIFKTVVAEYNLYNTRINDEKSDMYFAEISKIKRSFINGYRINDDVLKKLFEEYNSYMLNLNAIDFDDILRYAYQILVESQLVRIMYQNVYTHLFVDEAQDLNISQYELIKQIAGNKMSIIMVGDPKQSIYGFNGASSKILTYNFFQDFTDGIQFKMLDNYRSAKKIVLAANKVENTFPMEVKYPIEGVFEICSFKNEIEEAAWIEENIEYLKTNGSKYIENEIQNEDIAILGRNRYVFKEIEKLLISKGIPYCAKFTNNKGDIFESNLFNEFILGLKNIDNPYDVFHKNILIDMLESKSDINTDIFLLKTIKKEKEREYKLLCDLWREMKSVQFHSINSKIEGYIKLLQNESEKSLIDNDCVVWKTIATNFCRTHQRSNQTLETFLSDLSMGVTSLPSDSGITLSTVHMSKGLQYDVVYIIGMNEGTFPDYRSMTAESLIEEKHSFFVAVTRAKRICYITYPLVKSFSWGNKEQLKSSFLDIFK